jgi:hypothetical protein
MSKIKVHTRRLCFAVGLQHTHTHTNILQEKNKFPIEKNNKVIFLNKWNLIIIIVEKKKFEDSQDQELQNGDPSLL